MPVPLQADDPTVVVVGSGLAGLATALHLAPIPVTLVTTGSLDGECASQMAQGGIAAALGSEDSPSCHAADTLAAAAGLGDAAVANRIAKAAPQAIDWLLSLGAKFDRDGGGNLALGLEAAHSFPRIVHAGGDCTGREIVRVLVADVRATPSIRVLESTAVRALTQNFNGAVDGVLLQSERGSATCAAAAVILATGGIGGLFAHTTNPLGSIGTGLALGARAGAVLRDLEFVQFHPTALDIGRDPMPLASEALRGDGARLVDDDGNDVMAHVAGGALAPRDVVAATLFDRIATGRKVFLELPVELARDLPRRFPGIAALCRQADLSPGRIPVRPAAHYHMGGLKVDARGRTTVEGLWACGEVASTGLHGGNRLASNSLLEAVVCAKDIADDIKGASGRYRIRPVALRHDESARIPHALGPSRRSHLRALMDRNVGVVRSEQGLAETVRTLAPAAFGFRSAGADAELAALLVALSALSRRESRGAHRRSDYAASASIARSQEMTLDDARAHALQIVSTIAMEAAS